jgi:beta-glucosidase
MPFVRLRIPEACSGVWKSDRIRTLNPGQTRPVSFTLDASDFGFYDNSGKFVVEPGQIEVYAGDSSTATLEQSFTVTG